MSSIGPRACVRNGAKAAVGLVLGLAVALASLGAETAPLRSPLANAGPDQRVTAGATVLLAGSGRDSAGRIVRFSWRQIGGRPVALVRANRSTARFVAPQVTAPTPLRFRLTVTNNRGASASNTVVVTVVPPAPAKRPNL